MQLLNMRTALLMYLSNVKNPEALDDQMSWSMYAVPKIICSALWRFCKEDRGCREWRAVRREWGMRTRVNFLTGYVNQVLYVRWPNLVFLSLNTHTAWHTKTFFVIFFSLVAGRGSSTSSYPVASVTALDSQWNRQHRWNVLLVFVSLLKFRCYHCYSINLAIYMLDPPSWLGTEGIIGGSKAVSCCYVSVSC